MAYLGDASLAQNAYSIQSIGLTMENGTYGNELSESGAVVAEQFVDGIGRLYTWRPTVTQLLAQPSPLTGRPYSAGINAAGHVVGGFPRLSSQALDAAARWNIEGSYELLDTPAGTSSGATSIDPAGNAYGYYAGNSAIIKWPAGSTTHTELPVPLTDPRMAEGSLYFPNDVSDAGRIAGTYHNYSLLGLAFVFDTAANHASLLDVGPYDTSYALDISPSGRFITGQLNREVPFQQPVVDTGVVAARWDNELLQILTSPAGAILAVAEATNDGGFSVGTFQDAAWNEYATLWNPAGNPIDLQSLIDPDAGWILAQANRINNAGQILGNGYQLINAQWVERAFLLTPTPLIPDPAATPLLLAPSTALLTRRRRLRR